MESMVLHRWLLAGILLPLSACHFDSSTYNPDFGDEQVGEGADPGGEAPDAPDRPTPAPTYFASGESTSAGQLVEGSYADVLELDGQAEVIRAEVESELEKLRHEWIFEDVPAGQYELTLVAHPYSPVDIEFFNVDYQAGAQARTPILVMPSGDTMTSFVARVDVSVQADVEIRARLQDGARVLEEEPSGPGIGFGFGNGFGNGDDGPEAYRALGVDYVVLTLKNSITK
jgi:hypothetical protein